MYKINEIDPRDHPYLQITECIDRLASTWYCIGELPTERRPTVAIVGARKPTSYGREVTTMLARNLASRGVVIVSGLALGIDAIAHQAALDAGGTTIAVQANGLHQLTPRTNRHIADRIITSGGAIISEYPPGVDPLLYRFLERNRIVSGISDAVVITEAASRSGTLNTAAHALGQGKELFAVPGPITSPMSAGCNHLLAQGAAPATCAEDILRAITIPADSGAQTTLPLGTTELETAIIEALSRGERDGDAILAALDTSPSEFSTALTMLEINGVIAPLGANRWRLR